VTSVVIEHAWTRERVTLPVVSVDSATSITVRWALQSCYRLDLAKNTMHVVSSKARAKQPFCLWRAADIEAVRREVKDFLDPEKPERLESFVRHRETMPYQKPDTLRKGE
jgi:hypothetical protein